MALLHQAELSPTKLELLSTWLPTRSWYGGPPAPKLTRVATYRFDDPAGEVGVETMVVRAGDGPLLQVPMTYRGAPVPGQEQWLIGTTAHSVLGPRWVYDATGDIVYANLLCQAIFAGGRQAEEFLDMDGQLVRREPSMSVTGSGADAEAPVITAVIRADDDDPAVVVADAVELSVVRVLGPDHRFGGDAELTGTWPDHPTPLLLAHARRVR